MSYFEAILKFALETKDLTGHHLCAIVLAEGAMLKLALEIEKHLRPGMRAALVAEDGPLVLWTEDGDMIDIR